MVWILILLISVFFFTISLAYTLYIIIYIFSKENSKTKLFKIGLAAVLGCILALIIFKSGLFTNFPVAVYAYGAFSGLAYGIYKHLKKDRALKDRLPVIITSKTFDIKRGFNRRILVRSTGRLLLFMLFGVASVYAFVIILGFILSNISIF